jgi:NADP-dependent 3-hydroxy acid dehydrogenase YdfG
MQYRDLTDSVCVVTGASSGIGEASARALAAENARVILVARSAHKIEQLADYTHWGFNVPEEAMRERRDQVEALTSEDIAQALVYAFG